MSNSAPCPNPTSTAATNAKPPTTPLQSKTIPKAEPQKKDTARYGAKKRSSKYPVPARASSAPPAPTDVATAALRAGDPTVREQRDQMNEAANETGRDEERRTDQQPEGSGVTRLA